MYVFLSSAFAISLLLVLSIVPNLTLAHVSLTFPPARKYNLDYLDSGSLPPCGMPKGSIKTTMISGSTLNITWHLGYPHQGSHRVELLASNGSELYILASEKDTFDPTAQRQEVTLPKNFVCQDCIIRLLRQSAELGHPYFVFRSCGDVDIVKRQDYVETCSGNGRPNHAGVCGCRSGFWGKHCQYEDECRKDEHCGGGRGACIDLGGTALPRRQCFCYPGFIGKKCQYKNYLGNVPLPTSFTLTNEFLANNYLTSKLDNRFRLFWRLIEGDSLQIEFVLKVNGTSYVALGWRPVDFVGNCIRYPVVEDERFPIGNSVKRRSSSSSSSGSGRFTRQANKGASSSRSSNNSSSGGGQQRSSASSKKESSPPPRPPRGPHPMSCTDVVIGSVRGNLARILDYWSTDISTPREDSLWGGSDDLLAGGGWETSDGTTTLIFRKYVLRKDVPDQFNDWPLDLGPSAVIWARGQEHGEYVHRLPSGVDPGQSASVPKFYTKDEIKYHGHLGQRGSFVIDFLGDGAREFFAKQQQRSSSSRRN